MILIGSRAARYNGLSLPETGIESDWDIIGTKADLAVLESYNIPNLKIIESRKFPGKYSIRVGDTRIEFDATDNKSNQILFHLLSTSDNSIRELFPVFDKFAIELEVPSKWILYQIKRSHANFDVHWEKTINHVIAMQTQWNELPTNSKFFGEMYNARHKEAKERFGQKQERIKLNKSNDEFFQGGMNLRKYVHDDIHKAVAYGDSPVFEKCKIDLDSAKINKEMFFMLSHEDQINMAKEESEVITLERFYIPKRHYFLKQRPSKLHIVQMYHMGMKKLMKDLCKGWFQDFMIDNVLEIMKTDANFITKFENALMKNEIRKKEEVYV